MFAVTDRDSPLQDATALPREDSTLMASIQEFVQARNKREPPRDEPVAIGDFSSQFF